jgi:hypothetical protein
MEAKQLMFIVKINVLVLVFIVKTDVSILLFVMKTNVYITNNICVKFVAFNIFL